MSPLVLMIALTGGIGSGKSTVAEMLTARGAVVIDADRIAREVVEPGLPTFDKLVKRFGDGIVGSDGRLDRPALAKIAFATDESRRDLEAITHPAIGEEFLRQVAAAPDDAIVVHDIPLLAESNTRDASHYDGVLVVEAPAEVRLDRLEERGLDREDARARMAAQAADEQRRALATWVLDNRGTVEELERQVEAVWQELEAMMAAAAAEEPA